MVNIHSPLGNINFNAVIDNLARRVYLLVTGRYVSSKPVLRLGRSNLEGQNPTEFSSAFILSNPAISSINFFLKISFILSSD